MFLSSKNISAKAQYTYILGNYEKLSVYELHIGNDSPEIS